MAVPKVVSGHYDTLFLFDRRGIPLAADVRHLHLRVDSDEHLSHALGSRAMGAAQHF